MGLCEMTAHKNEFAMGCCPNDSLMYSDVIRCSKTLWCLDSGATSHMCNDRSRFENFVPENGRRVYLADNSHHAIEGRGMIKINDLTFVNVIYVPNLRMNLLSMPKITKGGYDVFVKENTADIIRRIGNAIVATGMYVTMPHRHLCPSILAPLLVLHAPPVP